MIISKGLTPIKYRDGLPRWLSGKELPLANAGDARDSSSTPGSGRSSGVGNGTSLQYSCLENPVDRGAWQATVHGVRVAKSQTRLSTYHWVLCRSLGQGGYIEIKTQQEGDGGQDLEMNYFFKCPRDTQTFSVFTGWWPFNKKFISAW